MFRARFLRISATLAVVLAASSAKAQLCDGGVLCADDDGDGFVACGCPWSGEPCDCDDRDPKVFPGAPERCDVSKDHDCSGKSGDVCADTEGCLRSTCVPRCIPLDDFGCAVGSTFDRSTDGGACLCAPKSCAVFGCPAGETCDDDEKCVPNCHPGVRCPFGQICRGFGCVDPCAAVKCPADTFCRGGRCVASCQCDGCGPTERCEADRCVEAACVGVTCPAGAHCEGGRCVDDCEGVVCPPKRVCRKVSVNGAAGRPRCVDLCDPSPCPSGFVCQWKTGACDPIPIAEGGLVSGFQSTDPLDVTGGGFLCASSPLEQSGSAAAGIGLVCAGVALGAFFTRRKRRPPRSY